jgi:hypothetical protein
MGLYGALWFVSRDFVQSLDDPKDWAIFVAQDKARREGYHPTNAEPKIDWHVLAAGEIEMYREIGAPIDLDTKPGDYLIQVAIKVAEDTEVKT